MDEEQAVCPAAPGPPRELPVVRAAPGGSVRGGAGAGGAAWRYGRGGTTQPRSEPGPGTSLARARRPQGGLQVAVDRDGPVLIVSVAGELDHDTGDGLRCALAGLVDDGVERIVVDFAELRFCDSTGLGILLQARIRTGPAGLRLELAGLSPTAARMFAITGADTVLPIHPDLGSALKAPDRSGDGPDHPLRFGPPTDSEDWPWHRLRS
ncbi:STAS domain-containing protein [Kitasatospora sp. NPDC048538]|uniref:STAS domain-containing protein n=1 Tax=unclassified Kitasatospora TaxID=2633591 RepID=UPI0033F5C385